MKTARTFRGSWYMIAMVATILLGELVAAELNSRFGMRASPVTVGFICAGLVAIVAMVFYDNADLA